MNDDDRRKQGMTMRRPPSGNRSSGAIYDGAGVFGTKTWGHTEGGSTPCSNAPA